MAKYNTIPYLTEDDTERYWQMVQRHDDAELCWLWCGPVQSTGYGQVSIRNRRYLAHRVAYTLGVGSIPDGMVVRHSCDTPLCCNPDHLSYGTQHDNMADAVDRGRLYRPVGHSNGNAKLSPSVVAEIRSLYQRGSSDYGTRGLAKRYGVGKSTIHSIVTNTSYTE